MKLLLYCFKQKPYLMNLNTKYFISKDRESLCYIDKQDMKSIALNGKIVAECKFEVEEIEYNEMIVDDEIRGTDIDRGYSTKSLFSYELEKKSCLSLEDLDNYLMGENGYAIYIKNLHIFDEPRELNYYYDNGKKLERTPKNILSVSDIYKEKIIVSSKEMNTLKIEDCYVISCSPQELCRILNKEQNILVKKRVLKEML